MAKLAGSGTWMVIALAMGCGGGASTATSPSTTPAGPHVAHVIGVCNTPSIGVCQVYYDDERYDDDPHSACTESAVPGTSGSWGTECPSAGRLGDCNDPNGHLQARFYQSAAYASVEAATTACESDNGTWVP